MADCCDPRSYGQVFGEKTERNDADRFRREGLGRLARAVTGAVIERGIGGWTMLEVGGGAGGTVVTMLEAGVARATVYDLSPAAEEVAAELIAEHGLTDRVAWHTGDFLQSAHRTATHDLVLLNRVLCCYPDMPHLVDAVAGRATRVLALSFPRTRTLNRIGAWCINALLRIRSSAFRVFIHDAAAIVARVEAAGFREIASGRFPVWEWHVWEKSPDD
jgi:hypothetical protein